jgi:hypothetical protein
MGQGVGQRPLDQLFDGTLERPIRRQRGIEQGQAIEESRHLEVPVVAAGGIPLDVAVGDGHAPRHQVGHVGDDSDRGPGRFTAGKGVEPRRHVAQHLGGAIRQRRGQLPQHGRSRVNGGHGHRLDRDAVDV